MAIELAPDPFIEKGDNTWLAVIHKRQACGCEKCHNNETLQTKLVS